MSIPLVCANCNSAFAVADELAGQRATCPSCQAPVGVSGGSLDDEQEAGRPNASRGPWIVAGAAGILAAAALLFALLSYSRARSLADSLAVAEQRADTAVAAGDDLKVRLADVERRAHEADIGREEVQTRLAVAERKADAAVAARRDDKAYVEPAREPAVKSVAKDGPSRRSGTVTLASGTKRSFTTLSGGRYAAGITPGGGRSDTIQRAPGELVLYPAGERLREVIIPVDSIVTFSIAARTEKDPDADDAERLFSVQLTDSDGKQHAWKVEAPLTVYIHWSDGRVVEQFLNRDLLGMTFAFEAETAKGK